MQLRTLAAENAALKSANAEREQRSQLDLQDLRNFCLASQEKSMDKDSSIHAELQQHQQDLAGRMSELETVTQELSASKQHTSNRLDKVCSKCYTLQPTTRNIYLFADHRDVYTLICSLQTQR